MMRIGSDLLPLYTVPQATPLYREAMPELPDLLYVLSKLRELGRLKKGHRIALLGIGSGLNCSMAEVEW